MKILYTISVGVMLGFFNSLIEGLVSDGNLVDTSTNKDGYLVLDFSSELSCNMYHTELWLSPISFGNIRL